MLDQFLFFFGLDRSDQKTYWIAGLLASGLVFVLIPLLSRKRVKAPQPFAVPTGFALQGEVALDAGAVENRQDSSVHRERRASARRKGNPVEVLVRGPEETAAALVGRVVDRSQGGLRISLSQSFPVGTLLTVRPSSSPAQVPWIQIQVKHHLKRDGQWELGCAFTQPPSAGVVLLFG
jgi:hypothetical protein